MASSGFLILPEYSAYDAFKVTETIKKSSLNLSFNILFYCVPFPLYPFLQFPPTPKFCLGIFLVKKKRNTNHLRNNSFYEFVPSQRVHALVPWVGITANDSLMWAERLPCWLSSFSKAHLISRDCQTRPITAPLLFNHSLSLFALASQAAIRICTLSPPHHHLFIYSFTALLSFVHSDFSLFSMRKKTQIAPEVIFHTCKTEMHTGV